MDKSDSSSDDFLEDIEDEPSAGNINVRYINKNSSNLLPLNSTYNLPVEKSNEKLYIPILSRDTSNPYTYDLDMLLNPAA
jgi:hypothetical protein